MGHLHRRRRRAVLHLLPPQHRPAERHRVRRLSDAASLLLSVTLLVCRGVLLETVEYYTSILQENSRIDITRQRKIECSLSAILTAILTLDLGKSAVHRSGQSGTLSRQQIRLRRIRKRARATARSRWRRQTSRCAFAAQATHAYRAVLRSMTDLHWQTFSCWLGCAASTVLHDQAS